MTQVITEKKVVITTAQSNGEKKEDCSSVRLQYAVGTSPPRLSRAHHNHTKYQKKKKRTKVDDAAFDTSMTGNNLFPTLRPSHPVNLNNADTTN